jgi:hypothetical protein
VDGGSYQHVAPKSLLVGHLGRIIVGVGILLHGRLRVLAFPLVARVTRGQSRKDRDYLRSLGSTPYGTINSRNVFTQRIIIDKLAAKIAISTTSKNINPLRKSTEFLFYTLNIQVGPHTSKVKLKG